MKNILLLLIISLNSSQFLYASSRNAPSGANRAKKACLSCQKARTKCNNTRPCDRCIRLGREASCSDDPHKTAKSKRKRKRESAEPSTGRSVRHKVSSAQSHSAQEPVFWGRENSLNFLISQNYLNIFNSVENILLYAKIAGLDRNKTVFCYSGEVLDLRVAYQLFYDQNYFKEVDSLVHFINHLQRITETIKFKLLQKFKSDKAAELQRRLERSLQACQPQIPPLNFAQMDQNQGAAFSQPTCQPASSPPDDTFVHETAAQALREAATDRSPPHRSLVDPEEHAELEQPIYIDLTDVDAVLVPSDTAAASPQHDGSMDMLCFQKQGSDDTHCGFLNPLPRGLVCTLDGGDCPNLTNTSFQNLCNNPLCPYALPEDETIY